MLNFVQGQVEDPGLRAGEDENSKPPDFHRDSQEYIEVFRGLQSERDAEIGQKGRLWIGTS